MEVSKVLARYMLLAAKRAKTEEEAAEMIEETLGSGKAFDKFKEFVAAQGGNTECIEDTALFEKAKLSTVITGQDLFEANKMKAGSRAYLKACNNQEIGMTSLVLGGGRRTKESEIDLTVGLHLYKHLGDEVKPEDKIGVLYANDSVKLAEAKRRFIRAYQLSEEKSAVKPVVYEVITKADLEN
jgi:pyrimidine-nucleoside phosphorylase